MKIYSLWYHLWWLVAFTLCSSPQVRAAAPASLATSELDQEIGHGFAESLVLKIGEERRFPMPANHHLWAQNKKILNITASGSQVLLVGQSEGTTAVQIGGRTFQIQVIQPVKVALFRALDKDLKQMLGLKKRMTNQQVSLQGKLYRWEDWLKLSETSSAMEIPYVMSAEVPAAIQAKANAYWAQIFKAEGIPPVPLHFSKPVRAKLSVTGATLQKYADILHPFGIVIENDPDAIAVAPVVKVQITVAEVRRDFAMSYGIKWPTSYQATLLSNGQHEFENFVLTANALEQKGQGKILASPSLLCRSGKSAEFWAGGEFPIKLLGFKSQGVVWKKYGIVLKVAPKADSSGRMSIALETEVSTIDSSRAVEGVPGLMTNKISSHFDLSSSKTIVLSGLIKNEEGKASEGLPLLSRLPILGALFSSRDFRENRTELIILVRPSVVDESQSQDVADASQ